MNKKERVIAYFEKGLYQKKHLQAFVVAGLLTAEEYETLTGEAMPA